MAINLSFPLFRALTTTGTLAGLSGGKLYAYEAGTSTPKNTYTDSTLGTPNANPVILDSNGYAEVWLEDGGYKFNLTSSADVQEPNFPIDNVQGDSSGTGTSGVVDSIAELRALAAGVADVVNVGGYYAQGDRGGGFFDWDAASTVADDAGVTIQPNALPAAGRWIRRVEGDVSVLYFGAKGDYIVTNAVNGAAFDNTSVFNVCFNYCRSTNVERSARIPKGSYLVSGALTCAVSLVGDQKGKIESDVVYGSATWNSAAPSNLDGSSIVWDKTVLGVGDVYLNNDSGDNAKDVTFTNITFYSLSTATVGGGKLIEVDSSAAAGEYNFGHLPNFVNCHVVNFGLAITINVYDNWTIQDCIFRGCKQVLLAGNNVPEVATNIKMVNCDFKNCGDASTDFIALDNVTGFIFNLCSFDVTSGIGLRAAVDQGVSFTGCFIGDCSIGAGGNIIYIPTPTAGTVNVDGVSFTDCSSYNAGGGGSDIDLTYTGNVADLTIVNSDLLGTYVEIGTDKVRYLELGNTDVYGIVNPGVGQTNEVTADGFEYADVVITEGLLSRTTDTTDLTLSGGDGGGLSTDGALIKLEGANGGGDVEITASSGTAKGHVTLNTVSGSTKSVKVTGTDDSSSSSTGSLLVAGGVGITKNLFVGSSINSSGNISADGQIEAGFHVQGAEFRVDGTNIGSSSSAIAAGSDSAGKATFTGSGASTLVISTTVCDTTSLVFIAPHNSTANALYVSATSSGSFSVKHPSVSGSVFTWWVIKAV